MGRCLSVPHEAHVLFDCAAARCVVTGMGMHPLHVCWRWSLLLPNTWVDKQQLKYAAAGGHNVMVSSLKSGHLLAFLCTKHQPTANSAPFMVSH